MLFFGNEFFSRTFSYDIIEKKIGDNMVVSFAATKDWYQYMMISIYSLLECTKSVKKVYLLAETDQVENVPNLNQMMEKYPEVEFVLVNAL